MKEVTLAYERDDLAHLLHLAEVWRAVDPSTATEAHLDDRCDALERTNCGLRVQLATLNGELRELRRSPQILLMKEFGAHPGRRGQGTPAGLGEAAESDMARLRELREFVTSFRDGRIDLARFMAGPSPRESPCQCAECVAERLAAAAELLFDRAAARDPGRRPRPRPTRPPA
jgi:hypothetical protein